MLSTRLLPLLCLLSLSSLSLSQDRPTPAVPKTCSVTKPANQPFAPPPPYPAKPSGGQFWFGTDRLWTALPENRSVDRVRALHSQRSHVQAKAGFLATRI